MRGAALGVVVLAATVAIAAWMSGRSSSFSGYSAAQLETLERGYAKALQQHPVVPLSPPSRNAQRSLDRGLDSVEQAAISLSLLEDERRRRTLLGSAVAVAGLAALALLLLQLRRVRRMDRAEAARLTAALGSPESLLAAERVRAAKLLGVAPDAPAEVVEEALAAQLAARDPARLVGLAPQLQRVAEEQRQALLRARDCLLGASARTRRSRNDAASHGLSTR